MQLIQQGWLYIIIDTILHYMYVHCLLIASFFPGDLSSLSAGWNHDEIHAAVWKRDVGQGEMMETKTWKMRGLSVSACVWMHMCNTSVSPPLLISSSCGLDAAKNAPQWLKWRDLDWNVFSFPAEIFPHNTKWLKRHRSQSRLKDKDDPTLEGFSQPAKS